MTALESAARDIDIYIGVAGDPDVQSIGVVSVPLRLLQALRRALEGAR